MMCDLEEGEIPEGRSHPGSPISCSTTPSTREKVEADFIDAWTQKNRRREGVNNFHYKNNESGNHQDGQHTFEQQHRTFSRHDNRGHGPDNLFFRTARQSNNHPSSRGGIHREHWLDNQRRIPFYGRKRRYSNDNLKYQRNAEFSHGRLRHQGLLPDPPDLMSFAARNERHNFGDDNDRYHNQGSFENEREHRRRNFEIRNRVYDNTNRSRKHFESYRPNLPVDSNLKHDFKKTPENSLEQNVAEEPNKISACAETDEYDLDDFELLLERHRLIQQQLSAIGIQEKNLQESILSNEFLDDDPDFVVIANPNAIENEIVLGEFYGDKNGSEIIRNSLEMNETILKHHNLGQGETCISNEISEDTRLVIFPDNTTKHVPLHESNYHAANILLQEISSALDTTQESMALSTLQTTSDERPNVQTSQNQAANGKISKRRRRRRILKNKNPNLQVVAKQNKDVLPVNKRVVSLPKNGEKTEIQSVSKRQKIENNYDEDNLRLVPMDIEDEYEVIDSLLDNDYYSRTTEESEPQVASEAPKFDDKMTALEQNLDSEKTIETTEMATDTSVASVEELNRARLPEDDVEEDDMLLRELLLQSLATKRAEKARAIIADQQSPSSPRQVHSEPSKTTVKEFKISSKNIRTKLIPKTLKPIVRSQSGIFTKPSPTLSVIEKLPFIQHHDKVIIQIGQDSESDSDDYHYENDNETTKDTSMPDTFGGAINDFLKEARRGSKAPKTSEIDLNEEKREHDSQEHFYLSNSPSENAPVLSNLQNCILEANSKLLKNRNDEKKDDSTVKLLTKKISLRKTRIDQQDAKIKRLKHLLVTAEKAKKTLSSQCLEFEEQAKSLRLRIHLRKTKCRDIEEELLQAKTILSTANSKSNGTLNSPRKPATPVGSPSKRGVKNASDSESKRLLAVKIEKSVAKMKLVLAEATQALIGRSAHPSRRKYRKLKEENAQVLVSQQPVSSGNNRSIFKSEKERLQKMEKELRQKLEHMKKNSFNIASVTRKETSNRNVETQSVRNNQHLTASPKRSSAVSEPDLRQKLRPLSKLGASSGNTTVGQASRTENISRTHEADVADNYEATSVNAQKSAMQFSVSTSNTDSEQKVQNLRHGVSDQEHVKLNRPRQDQTNRIGDKDQRVVEGGVIKFRDLFHDVAKLRSIRQEQIEKEATMYDFRDNTLFVESQPEECRTINRVLEEESAQQQHYMTMEAKSQDSETAGNFVLYSSPLLCLRSYRLSPWYRTKEKKLIKSNTYSHSINPARCICPFDLCGKCLDQDCQEQHATKVFSLTDDGLLLDLIMYNPSIAGVSDRDPPDIVTKKTNVYIARLRKQYDAYDVRMTIDELVLLLLNKLTDAKKGNDRTMKSSNAFNVVLEKIPMRRHEIVEGKMEHDIEYKSQTWMMDNRKSKKHNKNLTESQEIRYFEEDYNLKKSLETTVNDNPTDVRSWISLAKHSMSDMDTVDLRDCDDTENKDQTLNVLSKALEANPYSEDLWTIYLEIFSRRNNSLELREMCIQAIDYCRSYTIWWSCLQLEENYDDKVEICLDIVDFLLANPEGSTFELNSHRILEIVLYMLQLEIAKESLEAAVSVLRNALGDFDKKEQPETNIPVVSSELTIGDLAVMWSCYVSVVAFEKLPKSLFDAADSGPSKITNKEVESFEWELVHNLPEERIRVVFEAAMKSLETHKSFNEECIKDFIPVYSNRIQFDIATGKHYNALKVALDLSARFESCPEVSLMLIQTTGRNPSKDLEDQLDSLIHLKSEECVFKYAKHLLLKKTKEHAIRLLSDSVIAKFDENDAENEEWHRNESKKRQDAKAIRLYKRLLKISTELDNNAPKVLDNVIVHKNKKEYAFLWLNYCLLLDLTILPPRVTIYKTAVDEAFEIAVNEYTTKENRQILWLQYMTFKQKELEKSSFKRESLLALLDVGRRCLVMPADTAFSYEKNSYWNDFSFHNQVILICLRYLPAVDHGEFFKTNLKMMPTNIQLAVRACHHEMQMKNFDQARNIYGFILKKCSRSLEMWRMAIFVELKSKSIKEARWLYEEATKSLPCSASLWKDVSLIR